MTYDDTLAFFERREAKYARADAAGLAQDHTADGVVYSPIFQKVEGLARIEESYRALYAMFPDWQIDFEPPIVDGDRVAQPFHVRATHTGEFMGFPGTGRRFELRGTSIYAMRDGLIAEERRIYDFTGLLIQLGVLRSKPAR
jgi:predicted ester cyclase